MTLIPHAAVAAVLLGAVTAAHAVPYSWPTTSERPYAKLTLNGETVCATWLRPRCDVGAGEYRLHLFSSTWMDQSSMITISEEPGPSSDEIVFVLEECTGEAGATFVECAARCPVGFTSLGTECGFNTFEHQEMALHSAFAGECTWVAIDQSEPDSEGLRSVVEDNFAAATSCQAR